MSAALSAGSDDSQRTWSEVNVDSAKKHEPLAPLMEEAPQISVPTASDNAVDFLKALNPELASKLIFHDELSSITKDGVEIGSFKVKVDLVFRVSEEVFLVHASSTGEIDRVPCGTSIIAYITKQLATVEQHHSEFIKIEGHSVDRKTSLTRDPDGSYSVKRSIKRGDGAPKEYTHSYSADQMIGYISEGANILLQRLFVLRKTFWEDTESPAVYQFITFDTDCNICNAEYAALDDRDVEIGGEPVTVSGIERRVWSSAPPPVPPPVIPGMPAPPVEKHPPILPETWQSYFLASGHLASRLQVGSPISMTLQKLPVKPIEEDLPPKPIIQKKPLNYEEDVELLSQFNQKKDLYKSQHQTYLRNHPEFQYLLADFVQHVLLRKPEDVIGLAREYFSSFSKKNPDVRPYTNAAEYRRDKSQVQQEFP